LSLRELLWMAESRCRHEWNQTASIMALLANINRDPSKSKVFSAGDFHPMVDRRATTVGIDILKQVFVNRRPVS
jgi:hypothetical protein